MTLIPPYFLMKTTLHVLFFAVLIESASAGDNSLPLLLSFPQDTHSVIDASKLQTTAEFGNCYLEVNDSDVEDLREKLASPQLCTLVLTGVYSIYSELIVNKKLISLLSQYPTLDMTYQASLKTTVYDEMTRSRVLTASHSPYASELQPGAVIEDQTQEDGFFIKVINGGGLSDLAISPDKNQLYSYGCIETGITYEARSEPGEAIYLPNEIREFVCSDNHYRSSPVSVVSALEYIVEYIAEYIESIPGMLMASGRGRTAHKVHKNNGRKSSAPSSAKHKLETHSTSSSRRSTSGSQAAAPGGTGDDDNEEKHNASDTKYRALMEAFFGMTMNHRIDGFKETFRRKFNEASKTNKAFFLKYHASNKHIQSMLSSGAISKEGL